MDWGKIIPRAKLQKRKTTLKLSRGGVKEDLAGAMHSLHKGNGKQEKAGQRNSKGGSNRKGEQKEEEV